MNEPQPASALRQRRRSVQSAEVGMTVLKALARLGGAASLTEVAQAVGESTAKAHRYMASLVDAGLVVQAEGSQRYVLGAEAIHIGLAALRQSDPVRAGEPVLARLRDELGVSCFIAVMGNLGPTILRIEEPALPVVVNVRAGSVLPLLWSATGQAFLAFGDGADIAGRAEADLAKADERLRRALQAMLGVPADRHAIAVLRQRVMAQGCSSVEGLLSPGISAVGAPIRNHAGAVVAVLTALGASGGFDARPEGRIATRVRAETAAVSAALGYQDAQSAA